MNGGTVVVLTALDLEYRAVRNRLAGLEVRRHSKGTIFETGHLAKGKCRVALGLVGKGNHPAAVLAERAIDTFDPVALLFVGVAGALWPNFELGDVVVASHVYAYHGATSENDGEKARPRVWPMPHAVQQLAQHLCVTGDWARDLVDAPTVHFGAIASGEVAQYSRTSPNAGWIRTHYNDACAIDMEGAGIAEAAHLNLNLPVVMVRGISDYADGTKPDSDAAGWQPRAAANAAAFAITLAAALVADHAATAAQNPSRSEGSPTVTGMFQNLATGNAHVGTQNLEVHGGVHIGQDRTTPDSGLTEALAQLRGLLREAYLKEELGKAAYDAANLEVTAAGTAQDADNRTVALQRLRGLVADISQLATAVTAILTLFGATS